MTDEKQDMPDEIWASWDIDREDLLCEQSEPKGLTKELFPYTKYIRADLIKDLIEKWEDMNPYQEFRTETFKLVESLQDLIDKEGEKDGD